MEFKEFVICSEAEGTLSDEDDDWKVMISFPSETVTTIDWLAEDWLFSWQLLGSLDKLSHLHVDNRDKKATC